MADRTGDWEAGGAGIAVVDPQLWLSGTTRSGVDQIVRVDPATSRVIDRFPTPGTAPSRRSVWIVDTAHAALLRVQR
jgi:hypothetical protein